MSDEQITIVVKIKAKEEFAQKVKQEMIALAKQTRKEQGCINYDLHQAEEDNNLFIFYENWKSQKDLDGHMQKPYLKAFLENCNEWLTGPLDATICKMFG